MTLEYYFKKYCTGTGSRRYTTWENIANELAKKNSSNEILVNHLLKYIKDFNLKSYLVLIFNIDSIDSSNNIHVKRELWGLSRPFF